MPAPNETHQPAQQPAQPEQPHSDHRGLPYYGAPYYQTSYYGETPDSAGPLGALNPYRLLRVARKKWLTILIVLVCCGGAAAYKLSKTVTVFQAESLIEMSLRRPRILAQQTAVLEDQDATEEIFNTRLAKFKGSAMVAAACAQLRKTHPELSVQDLAPLFWGGMRLKQMQGTHLVNIQIEHTNPQLAADACNAFAEATLVNAFEENRTTSDAAVAWLETQSLTQRKELEQADEALLKFRQDNRIDILESQLRTVDNALLSYNGDLVAIESELAKAQNLYNLIKAIELKPENIGQLPAAIPLNDAIKTALNKWMEAGAERDALLTRYTAKHPEVEAQNRMVALYQGQALYAFQQAQKTAATTMALLGQHAESLRRMKAEQSKQASELESQLVTIKTHLAELTRTRDVHEASYKVILNGIQDARLAANENTAIIKIIERATVPTAPIKPDASRIIGLALLAGLVAGMGLALIIDTLEDHVTGPHDIETATGSRVLAVIPRMRAKNRRELATASLHQRFSQIAEAFAGLRSVLDAPPFKGAAKVVLVASSVPLEGKTITSCNLAIASAKNGQHTLLIDFDLRRPRLAGIFPMPPGWPGLLEFLVNDGENKLFEKLAYASGCPNLSIMASRPVKGAAPAELVGKKQVVELIAWARQNYDRVLVDVPPLGLVSDAFVLAGLADCVLVMARPYVSRKRALLQTIHRFREGGIKLIGTVINDVDCSKGSYYSPYYQHYYGHYHNYEADPKETKPEEKGPEEDGSGL